MAKCQNPTSTFSLRCYGVTQDHESKEYMLILKYAEKGDLRDYLRDQFPELTWTRKLRMLRSLSQNLFSIHSSGFTHLDLHPGNVLVMSEIETVISDFGLARHTDDSVHSKVYGVMPYVAPEILTEQQYSRAADVYSFSMLMREICSGKPPLSQEHHGPLLSVRKSKTTYQNAI